MPTNTRRIRSSRLSIPALDGATVQTGFAIIGCKTAGEIVATQAICSAQ